MNVSCYLLFLLFPRLFMSSIFLSFFFLFSFVSSVSHHAASSFPVFSVNSFLSALLPGCYLSISPLSISIPSPLLHPSSFPPPLFSLFLWWVHSGEDVPPVVPQCTSAHPLCRLLDCDWLVWRLSSAAMLIPGVFINPTLCSHCFMTGCRKEVVSQHFHRDKWGSWAAAVWTHSWISMSHVTRVAPCWVWWKHWLSLIPNSQDFFFFFFFFLVLLVEEKTELILKLKICQGCGWISLSRPTSQQILHLVHSRNHEKLCKTDLQQHNSVQYILCSNSYYCI